eukprot:s1373_g9.t1
MSYHIDLVPCPTQLHGTCGVSAAWARCKRWGLLNLPRGENGRTSSRFDAGEVFSDKGQPQGTLLLKVKRIYAPGALGRFILGDYVAASDKRYRDWTQTKDGRVSLVDGSYHLCKGPPDECAAAGQHDVVVHIGRWRTWKEDDLIAGEVPNGYGKEAKNLVSQYFKREALARPKGDGSRLPWSGPGDLNLKKDRPRAKKGETPEEEPPPKPPPKGEKDKAAKISALEKELKALKKKLRAEEEAGEIDRPKKKRPASKEPREGKSKKTKKLPYDEGGLGRDDRNEMGADWGDSPSDSSSDGERDEESDGPSSEETSGRGHEKPKEKKRKKKDKDDDRKKEKKGKRRGAKKSKKKRKKEKDKDKGRTERDKGPFGVGETKCLPKGGSESDETDDDDSSRSSQSFRKAPSGLTLHLRLQRYAQRHPGRLATRLLGVMERATRFEGAHFLAGNRAVKPKPCAVSYYLAILIPALKDRWNLRTQREMRVWAEVLDQLAAGRGSSEADIVAQRLKALEQSVRDGNTWRKAKFLELVSEEVGMTDKGEEQMMVKEVELEEKFRGRGATQARWEEAGGNPRGKDGKGSGKKGKGKGKRKPAEPAESPKSRGDAEENPEEHPVLDEAEEASGPVDSAFHEEWERALRKGLKISHLGSVMLKALEKLTTPLGSFRQSLSQHAVAPGRPAACAEVLPVSVEAVASLTDLEKAEKDWLCFICLVLNYQYCSGFASGKYKCHSGELSEKQRFLIYNHLKPAVERLIGGDPNVPSPEDIKAELDKKQHDYEGGSYVVMEELDFDKVIECWPQAAEAAVAPLEEFLEDDTRFQVMTPMSSILPAEEWPAEIPKSYVRASDDTWNRLVAEGYKRGLFQACPEDEVLRSPEGDLIVNGAGAVPKQKGDKQLQRFISIFCPLNAVSNKISGDEATLPYVGQITLLNVPDEAEVAKLPEAAEVRKYKEMPQGDKLLLYLDSVDQLRLVSRTMAKVMEGEASEEHKRFSAACAEKGLPTNAAKQLAGSLTGSLQGGELRSKEGVFMLHITKMRMNVAMVAYMLSCREWDHNSLAGVNGRLVFAAAFRRPILSIMDELFMFTQKKKKAKPPPVAVEEMVCMMAALPLAFTNVRAKIHPTMSATDASPTGAGSCTAVMLKRPKGTPGTEQLTCATCRTDVTESVANGQDLECPLGCGVRFCSLECYLAHKTQCSCKEKEVPLFSERWSGPNSPLTHAVVHEGLDVTRPFDIKVSPLMDVFSDSGKAIWDDLDMEEIEAEHHAPDCKTMSRARGKPFYLEGRWVKGPPALRDERHVMGYPNLRGFQAVQVRQGKRMALKSVKRCKDLHERGKVFTLEHPYRSFIWFMNATVELAALPGVQMAVYSSCCFGGRREKWTAILTNSPCIYEELHKPDCTHGLLDDYQPYRDEQGVVRYPTEAEAEYPSGMCQAYARGLRREMETRNVWPDDNDFRLQKLGNELLKYSRFTDDELRLKVAQRILRMEDQLVTGRENEARIYLLNNGHYRGTDVRLAVEHQAQRELVPYPAYRWLWRDMLSFRWKQEAHINELETQAMIAHIRRLLREPEVQQVRLLVIIDSQVLFYAVSKGRSPAKRINRLLRRLAALQLMGDLYVLPVWTLSAWNFADRPSRRA